MRAISWLILVFGVLGVLCDATPVQAQGGRLAAARGVAEFLVERFGPAAAREGVEVLAQRIESMAVRHGDEVFVALRKVGPSFFRVVEEAGVNGGKAVRIMAAHGEGGITWVLKRPKAMQLLMREGEEAAAVLVRHPGGILRAADRAMRSTGSPSVASGWRARRPAALDDAGRRRAGAHWPHAGGA